MTLRRNRAAVAAALLISAGAALAWQSALSTVGWTDAQAQSIAHSFFTNSADLPNGGSMSVETKKRWIGRSPAERAQAIRDLALHAKQYVRTPAFEKLYNGWIQQRYDAVDHGIHADQAAPATRQDVHAAMGAAAGEMMKAFDQIPADAFRMLLNNDIDAIKNSSRESDKRTLARLRQVDTLCATNLPEARKQYATIKALQLSGQTDEAALQASMAQGQKFAADQKRIAQQQAWNEHNLKAELRRRLTAFVALANSVDFHAKLEPRAGRQVFANPEYERKTGGWKTLYRLGKEPTLAAVAVAQQWLREL